mgnify:CR=1 FL=1|tara:strand:- start:127 stop:570 length:444 start_codon:yes stop_codon:yes gene_type:complete
MKKVLNLSVKKNNYSNTNILVVKTKWNEKIIEPMIDDCSNVLNQVKVNFSIITVPGAFEIPFMVKNKANSYDAVITLGAIIKGETPHFDIIAQSVSDQIMALGVELNKPVIFGVLTTNNVNQAQERSKTKGKELALSALALLDELDG